MADHASVASEAGLGRQRPPRVVLDQQIGPSPTDARTRLRNSTSNEFLQTPGGLGKVTACARIGIPSTATTSESSLFFIVLTSLLFLSNESGALRNRRYRPTYRGCGLGALSEGKKFSITQTSTLSLSPLMMPALVAKARW